MDRRVLLMAMAIGAASCGGSDSAEFADTDDGVLDVAALAAFVEQQRGHEFAEEPTVTFVDPEDLASSALPAPFSESDVRLLTALGIVSSDFDQAEVDLIGAGAGVCCPVRVIPAEDDLLTASLVVHELTHLLDLSVVGERLTPTTGIEKNFRIALVEGNATRIQNEFLAGFDTDLEALRERYPVEIPVGLDASLAFPYREGLRLAAAIAAEGGETAIDDALAETPSSAEQVMRPEAFLAGEQPLEVEVPGVGAGTLVRSGSIGPYLLWLAIGGTPDDDGRRSLVAPWAGDSFSLRTVADETCLFGTIVMDDADAASRLGAALDDAAAEFAVSIDDDRIDIERCVPS